jgi:hypothetical protein
MERNTRTVAALAVAVLGAAGTSAQPLGPRIAVHLRSGGTIPGEHVLDAEARASRIFEAIGVSIRWVNDESKCRPCGPHDAFDIEVTVLSTDASTGVLAKTSVPRDALGVAMVHTTRAYVFGERIREVARSQRDVPVVFGRVLAHEIGHLVLPGAGHSETGIMRADLSNVGPIVDPGFTPSQAESIRRWLTSERMLDAVGNGRHGFAALETD